MHSDPQKDQTREGLGTGFPIEGMIVISVIVLGVLALVLKSIGAF